MTYVVGAPDEWAVEFAEAITKAAANGVAFEQGTMERVAGILRWRNSYEDWDRLVEEAGKELEAKRQAILDADQMLPADTTARCKASVYSSGSIRGHACGRKAQLSRTWLDGGETETVTALCGTHRKKGGWYGWPYA